MTSNIVTYTVAQQVGTITFNRPAARNALTRELMEAIARVAQQADDDPATRVVVLRGNGPHFCAGADLEWMRAARLNTDAANRDDAAVLSNCVLALYQLRKPLIALVHGAAIGGGVGMVSVADVVIAERTATFGLSEVRLGIIPSVIAPFVIPKIGAAQAHRFFISGERMDAAMAQRIGLVHDVVEPGGLDMRGADLVQTMLTGGPQAVMAAKQMVREVIGTPPPALIAKTIATIAAIRKTPEAQEGIAAFFEKRKARWVPGA